MSSARLLVMIAVAAASLAAALPDAVAQQREWRDVRVFLPDGHNLQWLNFWVARGAGFFTDEGLSVELVLPPRSGGGARFLVRGRADIAVMPRPMFLALVGQREPVVSVANLLRHDPVNLVVRQEIADARGLSATLPLSQRLRGLQGLSIGVAPGPRTRLDALFRAAGLLVGDHADVVTIPGEEQNAALRSGRIDALYAHTPFLETALVDDGAVMLVNQSAGDVPELSDRQIHMIVTTREYIDGQADVVAAVVRAIYRAQQLVHAQREATEAALLASGVQLDAPRGLAAIVDIYEPAIPETPEVSVEGLLAELALFPAHREAPELSGIDLSAHVDNRFALDAVASGR